MTPYQRHIRSVKWQKLKRRVRASRPSYCEACFATDVPLQTHHLTYDRLGCELPEDVMLLCEKCHRHVHGERLGNGN